MKSAFRLSALLLLLALSACSKDLAAPAPDNPLVGDWEFAALSVGDAPGPDVVWDAIHGALTWWDALNSPPVQDFYYATFDYTFTADGELRRQVFKLQGQGGTPEDAPVAVTVGTYAIENGDVLYMWPEAYDNHATWFFGVTADTLTLIVPSGDQRVVWSFVRPEEE